MLRFVAGVLSIGLCFALTAQADVAGVEPNGAGADHVWNLTEYLKGKPVEIGNNLNKEVERLAGAIHELQQEMARVEKQRDSDEQAIVAVLRQRIDYQQAVAARLSAEKDLEAIRKTGSTQQKIEVSNRAGAARSVVEQMEHAAYSHNASLAGDRKRLSEIAADLSKDREGITKAMKWRTELLDATRNAFRLMTPVRAYSAGMLPGATVERIIEGQGVLFGYDAVTLVGRGKDAEGIQVYNADISRVRILVADYNASGLRLGTIVNIDQTVTIDKRLEDDKGYYYAAHITPNDADVLLKTIAPLSPVAEAVVKAIPSLKVAVKK